MSIDTWDVYVTDNGQDVVELLNGVSSIIYSTSIAGLVLTVMALALLFIAIRFIFTGGWSGSMKWFITSLIVLFALVAPRKPVHVQDYSDPNIVGIVEDVPLGLAAILSFSTVVGDSLVQVFETAFGTTDGSGSTVNGGFVYSTGGMLEAEKTFAAMMNTDAQNPRVIANVNSFLSSCVYPEVTRNDSFGDVTEAADLPAYFASRSTSALVFYRPAPTSSAPTTTVPGAWRQCSEVGPLVEADILAEANASIERVGAILHPDLESAEAASQYRTDLGFSADRFLAITDDGPELISQVMSINMIKRSLAQEANSGGEAALMDFVNAQASVQSRLTMSSIGGLMQTALPKMHSVLIMVLISIFPIIFTLAFLPSGGGILKNYFLFFLNLQVWPLMFAVFTRIIEGETAERAAAITKAAMGTGSTQGALTMNTLDPLLQIPSETSAIAAMMIGLIPGIAVMLTKGYDAVAGQVESTLRPINVATENAAGAAATGNISLKNANLDNSSIRTHTADQYKQSPSVDVGQFHGHTSTGAPFTVARNGTTITHGDRAQGSGALSANVGSYIDDSINKRVADARSIRRTATESHGTSLSAATADLMSAQHSSTDGKSFDFTQGHDVSESDRNTVRTTWEDAAKFAEENNLSGAAELRQMANVSAGIEGKLGFEFFGLGGGGNVSSSTGKDSAASVRAQKSLSEYLSRTGNEAQSREYGKALNNITSSRERDSSGQSLTQVQAASADLRETETYRKEVTKADNNIASLETAANHSSGFRQNLNANLMGRAQDIVEDRYGRATQLAVFGARVAPGSVEMEMQEAAIRQAIDEQLGGLIQPHDSSVFKTLQDPGGPIKGRDDVIASHAANTGNNGKVSRFAGNNAVLSDAERANAHQSFEENKAQYADQMQGARNMKDAVIAKQGGQDVTKASRTKGGHNIEGTYEDYTPRGVVKAQQDHDAAKVAALEAQPTETQTSLIAQSGGYGMGPATYLETESKVPLTDEQIAALPAQPQTGSLRDSFGIPEGEALPEQIVFPNTPNVSFGNLSGAVTNVIDGSDKDITSIGDDIRAGVDTIADTTVISIPNSPRNRGGPSEGFVDAGNVSRNVELSDTDLHQSAAAISGVMDSGVFARSVAENREYGGLVYRDGDGQIHATEAVGGFTQSDGRLAFNPSDAEHLVPDGAEVIGDYHTHGRAGQNQQFSNFSLGDIQGINNDNDRNAAYAGGFLVNPQGDLSFYGADTLSGNINTTDISNASILLGNIGTGSDGPLEYTNGDGSYDGNFSIRNQQGVLEPEPSGSYGFAATSLTPSHENAFAGRANMVAEDGYTQFGTGDELIQAFEDRSPISEAHVFSHGWSGGVIGRSPFTNEGFYLDNTGAQAPSAAYVSDFVQSVENGDIVLDNGASINFYGCNLDGLAERMSTELSGIGRDDISVMGADASVGAFDTDGNRLDDTLRVYNMRNDNFNTYQDGEVTHTTNEIDLRNPAN